MVIDTYKKTEEALNLPEEKFIKSGKEFTLLFENAIDPMMVLDNKGVFIQINRKVKEILGYKEKDLIGKKFTEMNILTKKSKLIILKSFSKRMAGFGVEPYEIEMNKKNGSMIIGEINASPIKENGKIIGDMVIIRDITEKKGIEQELIDSEQKYKLIFEEANDGILVADAKTKRFIFANPKICEITGYSLKELLRLDVTDIHPKKDLPYVLDQFRKQVERKIGIAKDIPVLRKDKKIVFCDVNSRNTSIKGQKCLVGFFRDITERKQVEEELIAEKNKIKAYLDSLADGITVTDKNANITEVNKAYVEMLGYKLPSDIIGKSFTNFIAEREIPRLSKRFTETIKNKEQFIKDFEVIDKRKDGSEFPTMVNMRILWNEGEYTGCISVIRNITESKKIEEKIKESEERFRAIFEGANDGILAADTKTKRFVFANPRICEITGYSSEELLKLSVGDINPKKDLPYAIDSYEKQRQGKVALSKNIPVLRKDGRVIYCDVSSKPIKIRGQEYLVGFFRDVTERKETFEEIKKSEEKYRSLIINIPDVTWTTDFKGNTIFISPNIKKIYGYTQQEVYEKGDKVWFKRIYPDDVEKVKDAYKKLFESGKKFDVEYRIKKKDGKWIWLHDRSIAIYRKDGILYADGIFSDISESKKTEEKFKTLYENSSDAIMTLEPPSWRFTSGNIAALKMFDTKNEKEFISLGLWDLSPQYQPDKTPSNIKAKKMIMKAMKEGSNFFKWTHKRYKGDDFPATVLLTKVNIEGKEFLQATVRDISRQVEIEEKYNTFFDNASDAITVVNPETNKFVEVNKSAEKLTGYSKKELLSMTFDLIHPKDKIEKIATSIRKALEIFGITSLETEVLTKDNKRVPVILSGSIIKIGNKVFLMGIFKDITEQKKAQEKLKASEARYRSYIEATKQLGWTTNAKGLITEDMPAWRAYTGQSFEKTKNWGWIKAIHPDDAKHTAEVWEKAIKTKSIYETEYRIRRKDGKYKWFLARGIPVFKEDGSIDEWVGTCIDISERIKTEEEVKKARDELQLKVEELERFNKLTIGRELKMVELKRKIKELEYELKKKENRLI